ncbi:ATP-dependent bile acid permease [Paramyrothecium foliicola]|nr:ATP-dependent bile acid permease [Paramyrothecium foliicola]
MAQVGPVPLSAAALAVVGLSGLPALFAFLAQVRSRAPRDNFYEDVDGKSTPEAVAAFSNKRAKAAILILSAFGFILSAVISVSSTLEPVHKAIVVANWLSTAAWAIILIQAIFLGAIHSSVRAHDLGVWAFASCVATAVAIIPQTFRTAQDAISLGEPILILQFINGGVVILLAVACLLLPRRPDVFFRGRVVDRQWTYSVLSRYTWTWGWSLLDTATKKGDLTGDDIPEPDHTVRSDYLVSSWVKYNFQGPLLSSMIWAYRYSLAFSWSLCVIRVIIGLGPFLTLLRLLRILEHQTPAEANFTQLWPLVLYLGLFTLVEQFLEGYVNWFGLSMMAYPLRAQLGALIFEKSLRRKIVKAADKSKDATEADDQVKASDQKEDAESDEANVLKSRQAIVNLVGVDARRVSNFIHMQFFIILSFLRLTIYSFFLVKLLGWLPFGAGILAWAVILPLNTYAAKMYMSASDKLMKTRDDKLAVVNEALLGIRQIKFAALEKQWQKRILEMREKELRMVARVFVGDTVLFALWVVSPILLAAASLATYAIINGNLSPSVAFVSIGIFKALEMTLGALPELLTGAMDTLVSIRRIDTYLKGPEVEKIVTDGPEVAFENTTVAWPVDVDTPEEDRFVLRNISLSFPTGQLSVISGKTGTGKSLLLSAILGEVDLLDGSIRVPPTTPALKRNDSNAHPGNWILPGSIAYVGQTPWLESTSLRNNILFGLPYEEARYDKVIEVCALKKDLAMLTDGDGTELGANGINLSGGQKWRITLARAIYSRAEILVMDDIFSAVDAHVGRQIFERCIAGDICKGRTRILVTHHVALVASETKFLVELEGGTVLHAGLTAELEEDGTLERIKTNEQTEAEIQQDEATASSTVVNSEYGSITDVDPGKDDNTQMVAAKNTKKFIEEETREKGVVKGHVYGAYFKASGGLPFWIVCATFYIAFEACNISRNWWLRIWTGQSENNAEQISAHDQHGYSYMFALQQSPMHGPPSPMVATSTHKDLSFYLGIYIALAGTSAVIGTLRFLWSFVMSLKASRIMFNNILHTVLRTPLRWLDTVPVGRILNRLTSDFDTIDNRITLDLGLLFWNVLGLAGICVAAALSSPYILPLAFVLVIFGALIGRKYMAGARPMKRLESNAKSPVFELFNAALAGMSTLRAFQKSQVYTDRMYKHLDDWDIVSVHIWLANRWMGFRMSLLGTIFTTSVGFIVISTSYVDAALAGFTLSFALDFAGNLLFSLRNYANLELDMNAAERVIEYSKLPTESQVGEKPAAAWPTSGTIEVKDLVVGYAPDLPPVLKGISFSVGDNERIGVVGRTGAGKSSLTLALFRFLEATSGEIIIDGLDISEMDLHSLRSRLAIIPQDPVLFSGTIRSNLDPFNDHSDEELRDSLSRVHLDSQPGTPNNGTTSGDDSTVAQKNVNLFNDLSSGVSESGGNLSQGQRQLLCLARAIVSRPKIMVLDEATSAVDMATDALIQRSIREEFTGSTLVVIAHRLSTIADFDRILVLSEGTVAEFGSPRELWEKEGGLFRDMCEHSGEKDKLMKTILGN